MRCFCLPDLLVFHWLTNPPSDNVAPAQDSLAAENYSMAKVDEETQLVTDISRYGRAHIFVISQFNANRRCTLYTVKLPTDLTYNRPRQSQTFPNFGRSSNRSRINTVWGWKPIIRTATTWHRSDRSINRTPHGVNISPSTHYQHPPITNAAATSGGASWSLGMIF